MNIGVEPYSSSSIIFMRSPSYGKRVMNLFVVTIDLKFIEFVVDGNNVVTKQIIKVNEIQLKPSLHYSKCRDLTYIKNKQELLPSQTFIMFCKGIRDVNETYYTIVMIKRFEGGSTTAVYYNYPEDYPRNPVQVIPDFKKTSQGLKYLKDYDDQDSPLKLFSCMGTDRINGTKYQMIMTLDIRILNKIGENSTIEGFPIIRPFKYLHLQRGFDLPVHDFLLIKNDPFGQEKVYFVLSVVNQGLKICGVNYTDFTNSDILELYLMDYNCQTLPGTASNYLTKPEYSFGLDEYNENPNEVNVEDLFFYGIRVQPPGIIEYNIEDINNVKFFKRYELMSRFNDKKIGTRYISININYLVHLVYDPETMVQSLRVYYRHASFKDSAKFDVPIELDYPMNFFAFSNYFFDCLVIRDERQVQLISFYEQALIINATESMLGLVRKYQNQTIDIRLAVTSTNSMYNPLQVFKIKFLEKNNVDILPINDTSKEFMEPKIFYNCGSNSFRYVVSSFYNGPNYNLQVQESEQSNKYFLFKNQQMDLMFDSAFSFENCRLNFLYPQPIFRQAQDFQGGGDINYEQDFEDELSKRNKTTILVCVDYKNQMLRSYDLMTLYTSESSEIKYEISRSTNQVWMPQFTQFFDFQFDRQQRLILGLAQNNFSEEIATIDSEKFPKYEMHFFEVQNQVIWKSRQPLSEFRNVTFFNYNGQLNRGLIVEYFSNDLIYPLMNESGPVEIYYIFKLNPDILITFTWYNINITENDRTIKAMESSDNIIFSMTLDKRIKVYQKWRDWNLGLQLIQEFTFIDPDTQKSNLIGFDIFDNRFFVTYRGTNLIEVYSFENQVLLTYKMRMPLYEQFSDYSFYINDSDDRYPDIKHLVRTYLDSSLAILMVHPATNDTQLLIYGINITQHNSFILNQSLTEFYHKSQKTTYSNLIFTGQDREQNIIGVMNDNKINLFSTQYYNQLVMSPNMTIRKQIIEDCKRIKQHVQIKAIDSIIVQPVSLFNSSKKITVPHLEKKVNITVTTQNQGMAVSLKYEKDRIVNITYGTDGNNSSRMLEILHETYIEGQGLKFDTLCQYTVDSNETIINCTKDVVNEQSKDVIYNFSIEFTTNSRRIFKQFTLGKLFFMFDTDFKMNVMRLPIYQQDLSSVSGFALRRINEESQEKLFGCNLTGFTDYYNLTDKSSAPNETYLFMYHCQDSPQSQWKLQAAIITAYNDAYNQDNLDAQQGLTPNGTLYSVKTFPSSSVSVPYQIIDLDKINIEKSIQDDLISFHIVFTCEIPGSETNLLKFYTLRLNLTKNSTYDYGYFPTSLSAYTFQMNSFKVSRIEPIRESQLILVVSEEFGIYFFNMSAIFNEDPLPTDQFLIGELNVYDKINFKEQIADSVKRSFKIISFSINYPSQIICITNYGIKVFEYPVDLRNTTEIIENFPQSLIPKSLKQIQAYYDEYSKIIVQNPYGNAFFVKTLISGDSLYQTQLMGMSFFSSYNSFVFKILSIPGGIGPIDQCSEINQIPYFEISPEDQLAVTFICNQFLYVYRMSMRPHVELNFNHIVKQRDSGLAYNPGIFQYNDFQLTLMAWNDKSGPDQLNRENVTLNIKFGDKPVNIIANLTDFIILMAISILLIIIAYLENALCREGKEKQKQKEENMAKYSILLSTHSIFKNRRQNRAINHDTNDTLQNQQMTTTYERDQFFQDNSEEASLKQLIQQNIENTPKSPRFSTFKSIISRNDIIPRKSKQTINNSLLTQSENND